MYTYTFPKDHFNSFMFHVISLAIEIETLTLNGDIYTVVCTTPFDQDQYNHLHEEIQLTEII
jgi:hypothetical protein